MRMKGSTQKKTKTPTNKRCLHMENTPNACEQEVRIPQTPPTKRFLRMENTPQRLRTKGIYTWRIHKNACEQQVSTHGKYSKLPANKRFLPMAKTPKRLQTKDHDARETPQNACEQKVSMHGKHPKTLANKRFLHIVISVNIYNFRPTRL